MDTNSDDQHANELLFAAERALFDAAARLQEAVSVIDRDSHDPPTATLARARQWSALITAGLEHLARRGTPVERPPRGNPLQA
jgi:hypothetical protein